MTKEALDIEAEEEVVPENLGYYCEVGGAHEHGLVILAMGAGCWVCESSTGGYTLAVEPSVAKRAREEIQHYETECRQQVSARIEGNALGGFEHPVGWLWHVGWFAVTGWMFLLRLDDPSWIARAGQSHDSVWIGGEWWRVFTALFIHGDVGHWFGNVVSGTVFAALCSRLLGAGPAWLVILLCGSIANACSSWLAGDPNTVSIGASTAVFAALGVFCAVAPGRKSSEAGKFSLRGQVLRFGPVIGGLVLLGWLGTGQGPQDTSTDVRSHLLGFAVGLIVAFLGRIGNIAPFRTRKFSCGGE